MKDLFGEDQGEVIAVIDRHTDRAVRALRENGRDIDDDDRAVIWNTLSRAIYEAARLMKEAP